MIRYLRLRFFSSDGTIWEQWYKNLVPIPTVAVPPSVVEKACCCDCNGGSGDDATILFEDGGGIKYYVDATNQKVFFALGDTYNTEMPLVRTEQNVPTPTNLEEAKRTIFNGLFTPNFVAETIDSTNGNNLPTLILEGKQNEYDTGEGILLTSNSLKFETTGSPHLTQAVWNPSTLDFSLSHQNTVKYAGFGVSNNENTTDSPAFSVSLSHIKNNSLVYNNLILDDKDLKIGSYNDNRNDGTPESVAWFGSDGTLKRSNLDALNINKHIPTPVISTVYHKELQHNTDSSVFDFSTQFFSQNAGKNSNLPVILFDGDSDPNNGVTFEPDYKFQKGVIYREKNNTSNNWQSDGSSYTQYTGAFSFDEIANQGVIWLGARAESGQDLSFFFENTPMLIAEVYTSKKKRHTNHSTSNDSHKYKKWQSWNFKNDTFENLNRPLNTKETGSEIAFNGLVGNNGCKYFASQWNFTPNSENSEQLFRLDVHALFGNEKAGQKPDFNFPVLETEVNNNYRNYLPRYLNKKGINGFSPTSFRQPIRFRFACIDPSDNRNLLYSDPSPTFVLQMKGGRFISENDNYMYQFTIRKGI